MKWASQMVLVVKNPPANAGNVRDMGLTLGYGRSPGMGDSTSLQYSCLENSMGRGTWRATVGGPGESWLWLSIWVQNEINLEKSEIEEWVLRSKKKKKKRSIF